MVDVSQIPFLLQKIVDCVSPSVNRRKPSSQVNEHVEAKKLSFEQLMLPLDGA